MEERNEFREILIVLEIFKILVRNDSDLNWFNRGNLF